MNKMENETKFNGWTNHVTWAIALWLDNEQGSYLYWREQAEEHWKNAANCNQVIREVWTREEAAKFNLADQLRDEIRDNSPLQEASMYSDLLTSALDEINWQEIAGNWLEDWTEAAEKEQKEAEAEQDKEENDKAEEEKEPEEWPVIYSYTRAQAIADGVLIDVSETAKEAGIVYPTAFTAAVWAKYVETLEKVGCPDEKARVAYLLFMFHAAAKASSPKTDTLLFDVIVMIDDKLKTEKLKSICGPGDSAEPVLTIMLPGED
jgi:hypothetical protein